VKKKYKLLKNFRNENIKEYIIKSLRNEYIFTISYLAYLRYEDPVYKTYALRGKLLKREIKRRGEFI